MKKIYLVLFCFSMILSSYVYGINRSTEGIKIGGISIFDNLYDYLSPKQVREKSKGYESYYQHLKDPYKFSTLGVVGHPRINEKYELVEIIYKDNQGVLTINGITAGDYYEYNIDECYKDMQKLVLYLSDQIPDFSKIEPSIFLHDADPSGNSNVKQYLLVKEYVVIDVSCTDWSEKITKNNGWTDNLSFSITSKEFYNYILGIN